MSRWWPLFLSESRHEIFVSSWGNSAGGPIRLPSSWWPGRRNRVREEFGGESLLGRGGGKGKQTSVRKETKAKPGPGLKRGSSWLDFKG